MESPGMKKDPQCSESSSLNVKQSKRYPRKLLGSLILIFAGLGHVGKYILAKYIEEHYGFPALQLMAIACFLSFLVYSCTFSVSIFLHNVCKSRWPLLRIICAGAQTVLVIIAFDRLPVGNVMAIYVTSGAFASGLSDDKLKIADWVAIGLSIMGVILISKPEFIFGNINESQMENVNPSDYWYIASGTLVASLAMIVSKRTKEIHGFDTNLFCRGIGTIVFLFSFTPIYNSLHPLNSEHILPILLTAMMNIGSDMGWSFAVDMIPIPVQALIYSMDKVWAYLLGIYIFGEMIDYLSIIGAVEVWFAMILQAFCSHDDDESKASLDGVKGVKKTDYDSTAANRTATKSIGKNPVTSDVVGYE